MQGVLHRNTAAKRKDRGSTTPSHVCQPPSADMAVCFQKAACAMPADAERTCTNHAGACMSLWCHREDVSAMLPTPHQGLFRGILRACVKKDLLPERSDEDRFTPAYKLIGDLIASEKIDGRIRLASARVNLLEACASKGSSSSRH